MDEESGTTVRNGSYFEMFIPAEGTATTVPAGVTIDFNQVDRSQDSLPRQSLAAFWVSIRGLFGGAKEADLVPLPVSLRKPKV